MTDISAMLQTGVKIAMGGIAPANPEETPAIEGFSELLALQIAGLTPAAPVIEGAPVRAAALPEGGKILPDGLASLPEGQVALPKSFTAADAESESDHEAALPVAEPALAQPAPLAVLALLQPPAPSTAAPVEASQTSGTAAPQSAPTAQPRTAPVAKTETPAVPVLAVAAPPVPTAALVQVAAPVAAMAAPVQFQVRARQSMASEAARVQPTSDAPPASPATPTASPIDLLRSRAPAELAPVLPVGPALAAAPLAEAPQGAPLAAAAPAAPARAETPMDFTQLVDRLVEARDAARPQAIEAAVAHAEFGRVSLRFAQGDDGLSVTMASADPDFARVAQSAAAAVPPPPASAPATSDSGAQGQASAQRQDAAAGHNPQQRAPSEQRAEQRPEQNNDSRSAATARAQSDDAGDASDVRGGIFA